MFDAQRVDARPGRDHRAGTVQRAILVDGGVLHAFCSGVGAHLRRNKAPLAQWPANLVVGVTGDGVVGCNHLGQHVQALVTQTGAAQYVALAEVGPVDKVVLVRVADGRVIAVSALVIAEQF